MRSQLASQPTNEEPALFVHIFTPYTWHGQNFRIPKFLFGTPCIYLYIAGGWLWHSLSSSPVYVLTLDIGHPIRVMNGRHQMFISILYVYYLWSGSPVVAWSPTHNFDFSPRLETDENSKLVPSPTSLLHSKCHSLAFCQHRTQNGQAYNRKYQVLSKWSKCTYCCSNTTFLKTTKLSLLVVILVSFYHQWFSMLKKTK